MATNKKRINITLSKDVEKMLAVLAKRDEVPRATKAAELISRAIEIEEDAIWDEIATKRSRSGHYVSHEKAWKI